MAQSYIAPALETWSRTGCEASLGCVVRPCIKKPREEGRRKRGEEGNKRGKEDIWNFFATPKPFWIKDLNICGFWQQRSWGVAPGGYSLRISNDNSTHCCWWCFFFFIDQLMNTGLFPFFDCCDHTAAHAGMKRPLRLISFCLAISPGQALLD